MNGPAATPGDAREASRAADDFRAALERRREAEDLLAEARAARQEAMTEAIEIVRVAESAARVIEESARASAQRILDEAAASHERDGSTIARLESMASEVQMVLDRALTDLTGALSPLAEAPDSRIGDPPSSNGDAGTTGEPWHERWRKLFHPR